MKRFPDGIGGNSFFQRQAPAGVPDWVRAGGQWTPATPRQFVCNDLRTLLYLVNLGSIELHPWLCAARPACPAPTSRCWTWTLKDDQFRQRVCQRGAHRRQGAARHRAAHLNAIEHDRSTSTDALLDNAGRVDSSQAVAIELPAGGAMLHHCQTFHYTGRNETSRQRRAFAIHFMAPGTRSRRTGDYLSVSFARPMLRMRA